MMRWTLLEDWARFAVAVMALVGVATWVWRVPWQFLRRLLAFLRGFMDDWAGVPAQAARPGTPPGEATPGVMERLQRIDGQMGRNGGTTLDGAAEQPLTLAGVWNGTTIDPLTVSSVT